jgi:hypothetical protein
MKFSLKHIFAARSVEETKKTKCKICPCIYMIYNHTSVWYQNVMRALWDMQQLITNYSLLSNFVQKLKGFH